MAHLRAGRSLTTTASVRETVGGDPGGAETLSRAGYRATPHVAARMVQGREHLEEIGDHLVGSGVEGGSIAAGDVRPRDHMD